MPNEQFTFKQFSVRHDRCAMKVGTDGVLLGAWAPVQRANRALDVGTGSGLIALMLAQRNSNLHVDAVEVDAEAAAQAAENAASSPFADRIQVISTDFLTYEPAVHYDLIVSNPPYFVDALGCPDQQRHTARHATAGGLNYQTLFAHAVSALADGGEVAVVLPQEVERVATDAAFQAGLYPVRCTRVFTKPGKPCRRVLLSFAKEMRLCQKGELYIEYEHHHYTPDYIALTRDFYLKM